ncbi:Hsp20/alpha crystallin family protein [Sulfitobacter aestuariivivens]|uniref:Hsp20/alpha crystallin family protein n=1 Tax=Sulfitobacter aestuariivivens TaxID=2766981 RepID=A0A927HGD7_9RHOB|nr:Hsp20/alpha crystallin family protein [Sulfitobacter aestuariivivens]MBD3665408.1 Hsp20/alpha crystallin family protein [Sulfitobacter aestuariivivens]
MSRQTLPQSTRSAGEPALFPSLQKEMNRLFDQFKSNFPMLEDDGQSFFAGSSFPAIDVVETDDAIEVSAEVPGVKEDDLDVTVSGELLVLKGEKSADHEEKQEGHHRIERRYGSFRRQIPLGFTPDDGAVKADFSDGILKLSIAKPPAAKAAVQKINIKKV